MKHTFAWTIERFSERQEQNSQVISVTTFVITLIIIELYPQFLWSSKFTIRGPDDLVTHWKMKLYPKVSQASDTFSDKQLG